MPRQSPIEQARRWWKKNADADHYVVPPTAAPSAAVARVLRQEGLVIDVAGKRAWILTAQRPLDRRAVFVANYWPVVALVLGRYEPAALAGLSALKLHLEDLSPPEELLAHQSANQSEYALPLEPGFIMRLRPRTVPAVRLNFVDAPGGRQGFRFYPLQTSSLRWTNARSTPASNPSPPGSDISSSERQTWKVLPLKNPERPPATVRRHGGGAQ